MSPVTPVSNLQYYVPVQPVQPVGPKASDGDQDAAPAKADPGQGCGRNLDVTA
jgi:hypothetical protein